MFLKLIGGVIILTSSIVFGYYMALEYKYRIWTLDELKTGIIIFKSELIYSAPKLSDIFAKVSEKTTLEVSNLFSNASKMLAEKDGENAESIWDHVLDNLDIRYMSKEDIKALSEFGKSLGQPLRQSQIQSADILVAYIDEKREEARLNEQKNSKLLKSGGVLIGILVVIVLI